ncbi:amidohydrolase [Psychrobacillus soli]|uniref:Amidohydrolase n=1 Tax=Psychrobacillus soli TaxID=1543965 RepID=A0A544SWR4_9BACI|nr:amidohydrolase [Psychrobacillus soli]TQR09652.1 amidohydrolase [Psychrobacillus soli]
MSNSLDMIIKNANIITLDKQNTRASSLAVKNGLICGIWTETEPSASNLLKWTASPTTEVIDLKGATLLPGFIDTHNHILMYGLATGKLNCSSPPNRTINDILELVRLKAKETKKGYWIEGYGYDDTLLAEKRHPTKEDLDSVSPHHPVLIKHITGHLVVANSVALQIAGVGDNIQDPKGGHFGRDNQGRLNGVLYEATAITTVVQHIPQPSKQEMISSLGIASQDYVAQGITTNSDAAVGVLYGMEEIEAHLEAAKLRVNPMRAQLMIMHHHLRENGIYEGYTSNQLNLEIQKRSGGFAKLDSAKMFQDGSIQGLTGALRQPYYNDPSLLGNLIHDQQLFREEVLDLHKRGFRITTHGNGDRAIESILDAYAYALENNPRHDHRHRVEHVQTATSSDLDKMKALGVAGSFFVNHVYYWGDRHERLFLGPERARRISPVKEAIDRNLLFTLHSDCPVTPISPLFSVWAAVNRLTKEGRVLGPEQRCDVVTALKSMTIYGAKLNFDEENSGSIELGKRADFAVLEADPTSTDPKEIKNIKVIATFIDGIPVFGNRKLVTS